MVSKRIIVVMMAVVLCAAMAAPADDFGTGANQFTIDFVTISGDASSANGTTLGDAKTFTDPAYDYRMGVYEITNDQWNKFKAGLGVPVMGDPASAYDKEPTRTGANMPTDMVSWYEAAQFVNYLNTSTGHHAAYSFTGTQGSSHYTFDVWSPAEADGGTNLYRHKDAFYFLPTEDEWVKAAYWNGSSLQTYATKDNSSSNEWRPTGGPKSDGQAAGWNYGYAYPDNSSSTDQPWDVTAGYGSEELNGTFDMMGNLWEWVESPNYAGGYVTGAGRTCRGSSYDGYQYYAVRTFRTFLSPYREINAYGFRVASEIPEPCSLVLLSLGGLALLRRRRGLGR